MKPAPPKAKREPMQHVSVYLDEETLARIDALRPSLSAGRRTAKRSDVLRMVTLSGLTVVEEQQRAAKRPAKVPRPRKAREPKG